MTNEHTNTHGHMYIHRKYNSCWRSGAGRVPFIIIIIIITMFLILLLILTLIRILVITIIIISVSISITIIIAGVPAQAELPARLVNI